MDRSDWEKLTHEEIGFWDKWLQNKGGQWPEDYQRRIDPQQKIPDLIERALIDNGVARGETVRVLDLGSGPLTYVGCQSDHYKVEVIAVDPLADEYNSLINKYNIPAPVLPRKGEAEKLDCLFPVHDFDVVWICNSLDHSYDPVLGFFQAYKTLKIGGIALIVFHPNEADHGDYQGLHNWNFDVRNGSFIIESRGRMVNVSNILDKHAKIKTPVTLRTPKSKMVVEVKKITDIGLFDILAKTVAGKDG